MARRKQPGTGGGTGRTKTPGTVFDLPGKTAGVLPQAHSSRNRPSWRFGLADKEGPWALNGCDAGTVHGLIEKLRQFETMTSAELERSGETLKHYSVDGLPTREALNRLAELNLDDQTRISRLRLDGKTRLYGFLDEDCTFHVVWWDPEHEIWPSCKKHT